MFWFLRSLLTNFVLWLFWPWRAMRTRRAAPPGAFLKLDLKGPLTELNGSTSWIGRLAGMLSLETVRRVLRLAAEDSRVAGVFITLRSLEVGSAVARSLRELLLEARARGQRVFLYLPFGGGTRETGLASAAHRLLVGPQTELAPIGFAVQAPYVRGILERAGIEPEVFARGRYKTAGESLVLKTMSEPEREQLSRLLDTYYEDLIESLSIGRGVTRERAETWINQGPWSAEAAVREGLADHVVYEDEIGRLLAPDRPGGAQFYSARKYLRRRTMGWRPWQREPYLAVVELSGPIVSHGSHAVLPVASQPEFCAVIERVQRDPNARGLLLYINSPGGGAMASDRMLRRVQQLGQTKPVVAYLADVAASGGYLVAMGARTLVAQPTSITGSIGVVMARLGIEPLLERLGVATETVKRGARADLWSPARHSSEDERRVIERQLDEIYQAFVSAVARGRQRSTAEIEPLSGGRVYSGRDALSVGLVDRLGNFELAVEELRRSLGAGAERFLPVLVGPYRASLARHLPRRLATLAETALRLPWWAESEERFWYWCGLGEVDLGR